MMCRYRSIVHDPRSFHANPGRGYIIGITYQEKHRRHFHFLMEMPSDGEKILLNLFSLFWVLRAFPRVLREREQEQRPAL